MRGDDGASVAPPVPHIVFRDVTVRYPHPSRRDEDLDASPWRVYNAVVRTTERPGFTFGQVPFQMQAGFNSTFIDGGLVLDPEVGGIATLLSGPLLAALLGVQTVTSGGSFFLPADMVSGGPFSTTRLGGSASGQASIFVTANVPEPLPLALLSSGFLVV
jgi:hypothetical protein